jgi:Zn ribbon nucleic-acid-binding protein
MGEGKTGDYSAQWAEYRRRRNIVLLVFATYVPGVMLLGSTISRVTGNEKGFFVVAICWMAAFVGTSIHMTSWECPRCGKWFHAKWWMNNSFAGKCVHCGLRKWAESADDERRAEDS